VKGCIKIPSSVAVMYSQLQVRTVTGARCAGLLDRGEFKSRKPVELSEWTAWTEVPSAEEPGVEPPGLRADKTLDKS